MKTKKYLLMFLVFLIPAISCAATLKLKTNKPVIEKKKTNITTVKITKKIQNIKIPVVKQPVVRAPSTKVPTPKPNVKLVVKTPHPPLVASKTPLLTKSEPKITKPLFKQLESPIILKPSLIKTVATKTKKVEATKTLQANTKKPIRKNLTPKNIKEPKYVFVLPIPPVAKKLKIPATLVRR